MKSIFKNHIGYANRISRQELCRLTGLNDSSMRIQIQHLRECGVVIVSHHCCAGYFKFEADIATAEDWYHYNLMMADLKAKLISQWRVFKAQRVSPGQLYLAFQKGA